MHLCLSMLLLLLLAVTSSGECDYLFIVHDAGESNFLLPLVDDFNTKNVKVLALGEPAISIFGDLCLTPAELGVDTQIIDGNDGRNQTLKENDVNQILNALSPVHEAVLTGMVFAMQAQLSSAFLEAGSPRVIGVDDSYSLWSDDSILNTDFIAVKRPVLNEIFLSAYLSKSFAGSGVVPSVTGLPTLSTWRKTAMEGSFETRQVLQRKSSSMEHQDVGSSQPYGRKRNCLTQGCAKYDAGGGTCISHGGGKRCQTEGCTKRSLVGGRCGGHGGGTRCKKDGCSSLYQSGGYCIVHGGGKKCKVDNCMKNAKSGGNCISHGGGKRCQTEDCTKSSRSRGYCIGHGGGRRCQTENCMKSAQSGGYCVAHGGGKKCGKGDCVKNAKTGGYCVSHRRIELFYDAYT